MATVQFLFDFGSPNAFLAHRVVPEIEKRTGVKFEYVPVLLGGVFKATGNKSPAEAFGSVANKMAYERLETERFLNRHRISDFKFNPYFPVNTLLLMRMAVAAEMDDHLPAFIDAGCRHMWVEPKKMDDPVVVRAALVESGLDAERLLARSQEADVKGRLIANTNDAVARGTFGIPTFFVGSEIYFGKDRLRDVEEAIVAGR
jgi:2-hydroxychromene-2-carboxylate isomerase